MIRFNKPVKLYEWGTGTNTTNQIWMELGEGDFVSRTTRDGKTTLVVRTRSPISKKNEANLSVKLAQVGEGMAANSKYWGEVALGNIKSVSGNEVTIELPFATKISGAAGPIARFFGLP